MVENVVDFLQGTPAERCGPIVGFPISKELSLGISEQPSSPKGVEWSGDTKVRKALSRLIIFRIQKE